MRLDLFLKKTLLVKRRALAQELIKSGMVFLNGNIAKPGKEIKAGDILYLPIRRKRLKLEILEIPSRPVKKGDELRYYKVLKEEIV
jgi:ribosomal 50S subunit-recycling heat shock protein